MTQWVGEAWEVFNSEKYDNARFRYFEKTGCLMSADGSGDEYITPEGTMNYRFVRLDPSSAAADDSVPTEIAEEPDSDGEEPTELEDAEFADQPDAHEHELGDDDPELAPADLMSFSDMVKLTVAPGEQLRMLSAMPPLDANLVGKCVAVRIVDVGWCAGKVCGRSSSNDVLSYNYKVRYDADDVQLHWLTEARYVGSGGASATNDWDSMDAHPSGSWAVFVKSVLPQAPHAGRVGALRAPPELVALGRNRK